MQPVDNILDAEFLRHASALDLLWMESVECRGLNLVLGGPRQEVSGHLLRDKLVVGHVCPEGIDDPVSPRPDETIPVDLIAVCVRVARDIEPLTRHSLGVGFGGKKPVNYLLVCLWRLVRNKSIELCQSRGKPRDIECNPAQPAHAGGLWIGGKACFPELIQNE